MGLRETKAARTRNQIIDVALELFLDKGYEATTMEEIAEVAEIGTSTLYRYFPAKDQILLGPFESRGTIAAELSVRPAAEPLAEALAHSIRAALESITPYDRQHLAIRAVIDRSIAPRARLWDIVAEERLLLENAIAGRLGISRDDIVVVMAARIALLIVELAGDTWRGSDRSESVADLADEIMVRLGATGVVLPTVPGIS